MSQISCLPEAVGRNESFVESAAARVLLTESNETRRAALVTALNEAGYAAASCPDADAVVRQARSATPDVVILDAALPRSQAEQCMRALKRCASTAGVSIVLTLPHLFDPSQLSELINQGVIAVLPKPFARAQLLETVKSAAAKARRKQI
ncbi:MAG: response regulator [Tepidisphaeraceae bacterium]|jgi:DNA-binding response OmpR family regulator